MPKQTLEENPMDRAGIFSKLTFMWLLPLFKKGYSKPLEFEDLFQGRKKQSAEILGDHLSKKWSEEILSSRSKGRKPSFIRALFRSFGFKVILMWIVAGLDPCVIRVIQPLLLGGLIKYFNKDAFFSDDYIGWLFASGIVLSSIIKMVLLHSAMWGLQNMGMELRIAICNLLYRKALRLSSLALCHTTVGQMVNLLSNDVSRFEVIVTRFHAIWIGPLQAIIITAILWHLLGPSCFIAVIFPILNFPFQGFMSKVYSRLCRETSHLADERTGLTNEIINMIKSVKIQCWEGLFEAMINESRRKEVNKLLKTNYYNAFNWAFFFISGKVVLFSTIIVYILLGNSITTDQVFITMILIDNMNDTMIFLFPFAVTSAAETLISGKRIQKFLELEEKEDTFLVKNCEVQPMSPRDCSVEVNSVSASWIPSSGNYDLNDISFNVAAGQLLAVVGTVGSGKSSILHIILGELPINSGSIKIKGKLVYVSQEPWLFTGTIKQNILFGQPFHFEKYKQVIAVCALEKDLELLPDKDQTFVGEKGDALSGGQKARINLARAVYFDADIYLLDDPLSAVDTHVARHLYKNCLSNILSEKVCILVTHQLQFVKSADQIIVLKDGNVQMRGTSDSLEKQRIDYKNFDYELEEDEKISEILFEELLRSRQSCQEVVYESFPSSKSSRFRKKSQDYGTFIQSNSQSNIKSLKNNMEEEAVIEVKASERCEIKISGALDTSIYFKYLTAGGGPFFLTILAVTFLIKHAIFVGIDYWLAFWLREERKSGGDLYSSQYSSDKVTFNNITLEELINAHDREMYLYIYTGLIGALIIATIIQSVLYARLCATASEKLHKKMISSILKAKMSFFDKHSIGQILNRFSNDLGKIDLQLPTVLYDFIKSVLFCAGSLGIVSSMNYWILPPFLLIVVIMMLLRLVYLLSAREIRRLEGIMRSPVFSHFSNTLQGLTTIRSFKAQKQLIKDIENHQDMHTSAFFAFLSMSSCFCLWLDVLAVAYVGIATFSFFGIKGDISGNEVGLSVSSAFMFAIIFMWGVRYSVDIESHMISVERVLEYTKLESEIFIETQKGMKTHDWPNAGNLRFQNVFLHYDKNDPPVLKNVSFNIEAGQKIGIVGRTGAGKSSILTCLLRLTHPEGKIFIDDINTESINLCDLRESISVIPQDPTLFKGTIKQNLDPMSKHSDEELWNVLEEVGLKQLIGSFPDSLSALVTQGGDNLSIGQRQLVCLARTILKHNKMVVMDEATSNLDSQTDSIIQRIIRSKFADCTVLTITHRIKTIIDSDKVIVMDAGEVKELSSPHELLQDNKSLFTELIRGTDPDNERLLRQNAKEAYTSRLMVVDKT